MTLRSLVSRDGTRLFAREWARADAHGTVVITHGLGEHIGRFAHVADWLVARGWRVVGFDHRGHGQSAGARGVIAEPDDLLRDLATVIDAARPARGPCLLLGHSMGGAVAAHLVAEARAALDGLILSSPALAVDATPVQRLQLWIGERLAPSLAQGNGLDANALSHDAGVVRAYRDDPLVHDRISARLARAIITAGELARAGAPTWRVPTLLLYGGADRIVAPRGSDAFAAGAPRDIVETERFDALYHEIFNEGPLAAPVFARLERWLAARVPR